MDAELPKIIEKFDKAQEKLRDLFQVMLKGEKYDELEDLIKIQGDIFSATSDLRGYQLTHLWK